MINHNVNGRKNQTIQKGRHYKRQHIWKIRSIAVLVVLAAITASCSSSTSAPTKSSAKLTTIRVIWQPSGEFGYYYANAHNIWAKFGLKIVPTEIVTGPEELAAMASDSADIAYMGAPPGITGISKGINMVAVAAGPDEAKLDGLYVSPSSGITNIKDIVGKTIGVPKDTTANVDMYLALKNVGISPSSVHIDYLNPPQLIPAIQHGDIQGAFVWDEWGQRLIGAGNRLIVTSSHLGVTDAAYWWAQKSYLASHPKAVAEFVAALAYSAKLANHDPGTVIHQYATISDLTRTEALTIFKDQPATTAAVMTSATGGLSFYNKSSGIVATTKKVAQALVALGDLSTVPADLQSDIAVSPLKQAVMILRKVG